MLKIQILCSLFLSLGVVAQESPYELLDSLNSEASVESGADLREPASQKKDQIEVRPQLPEAKQKKTARAVQWEVLNKKTPVPDNAPSEHGD